VSYRTLLRVLNANKRFGAIARNAASSVLVHAQLRVLVVVQARAPQLRVFEREAERV
jgi:hypothetical protein